MSLTVFWVVSFFWYTLGSLAIFQYQPYWSCFFLNFSGIIKTDSSGSLHTAYPFSSSCSPELVAV